MAGKESSQLSLGTWLGLIISVLTIVGIGFGALGTVFASKDSVTTLDADRRVVAAEQKLRDWRLRKVEVQVANVEAVARRTDDNLGRLLTRFKVEGAPPPEMQAAPEPPTGGEE